MDTTIIFSGEAELIIQSLREFDMNEIGSLSWHKQHDYMEKLNMQAILSASNKTDEFIKEFLLTYKKLPQLIFDLLLTEIWLDKVFPKIIENGRDLLKVTFPLYLVAYHEAILLNLLETILYHQDAMESIEDVALDFVDYCYKKVCFLCGTARDSGVRRQIVLWKLGNNRIGDKEEDRQSQMEELTIQRKSISYEMGLKTVSLIRYFTDYLEDLPPGVANRLLNHYDAPLLLVELLESAPWIVETSENETYKYIDNTWRLVTNADDILIMNKIEGQIWIALYQMLLGDAGRNQYVLHEYRKSILLRLRRMLTEPVVDQMPCLLEMRRFLEQLALINPPAPKKDLILEQTAELQLNIIAKYETKWDELANCYIDFLNSEQGDSMLRNQAREWVANYENQTVLDLVEPPCCSECGSQATKRCSRCKVQWYCGRQCQLKHWPKHKMECGKSQESKPSGDSVEISEVQ